MATADLLFRITGDNKGLKSAVSGAKSDLDQLAESATGLSNRMLSVFPPSFATAAKGVGTAVSGVVGALTSMQGIIATMGVGAVVGDFLRTTGSLSDLSAQTDITIQDLQRFQYAGDQVGVSLDSIVGAVGQLQNRLGSGDKSAFKALGDLSLTFAQLQKLDPGQQFEAIASAIARVPDPTQRAAIAMDLFGRSGVTLLPLLRSDMKALGDEAFTLSDATVKAGDSFGDLISKLTNWGKAAVGTVVLGPIVKGVEQVILATQDAGRWVDVLRQKMDGLPSLPNTPKGVGVGNGAASTLTMSMAEADRVADDLTRKIQTQLVKAQEAAARSAREAAAAYRELTTAATGLVERGIAKQIAAERELFGQSVQNGLIASLRLSRQEMVLAAPAVTDWGAANQATTQTLKDMVAAGLTLPAVTAEQARGFVAVNEKTVTWEQSLTDLALAMTQLSQTASSGVVNALASVVNGINVSVKAVESLKGGLDQLTSGKGLSSILSGFTGIVGGIGGLVSAAQAAINIGKSLFNLFDRDKGRDLVEDFVKQFGGFEGIQKIFAGMGDEGHRLWVMLTQGVGRNNPDQARRAIEEVEKAMAGLGTSIEDGIGGAIDSLRGKEIHIPIKFDVEDPDIPALAAGGIVRRPTLALIGEAGPEAVVPLSRLASTGSSDDKADLAAIRRSLERLPETMFRAMRDAKALAS